MEWKSSRIVDSNGQKYRVGWDEHGWFSIEMGDVVGRGEYDSATFEEREDKPHGVITWEERTKTQTRELVEYEDTVYVWEPTEDQYIASFHQVGVREVIDAINEGL